ncbi:MAG: peptide chain release factor 2 [Tenericutes bacterium]|jgi:peptide chain release factor 2|nr:peptide chain release factor 2 [Mycoplasmatota bacterium]
MLQLDELKKVAHQFEEAMDKINQSIDIDKTKKHLKDLEDLTISPDFWLDNDKAQKIIAETNELKDLVQDYQRLNDIYETVELSIEMLNASEKIDLNEIEQLINEFDKLNQSYTLKLLLNESYDKFNAIIEFHPGAGGTESQDWAEMLFRMYKRYCDKHDYQFKIIDYLDGDEAGLKSATVLASGKYAYGYLKAESGVHRLVRISPFDSSGRRHTSFASVKVYPEIDDSIKIEIDDEDIRVDTYRSSGKGGQGVNTTDSAIRITHLPTNIVVTCQNERSQIQNKETAMKVLKGKLYNLELEKKHEEIAKFHDGKLNAFGSQIRSYVFHPYTMVKDHRTNFETGNGDKVLDGDLDDFIFAYLTMIKNES